MDIEKIYYQRNFSIGAFLFETIGIGITINKGEDAEQALNEAKRLVCEYNEKSNPHLQETNAPEPTTLPTLKVEREQGDAILEGINAADSWDGVKGLKSYQYLVKSNPIWLEAFNNQKTKLGGIIG